MRWTVEQMADKELIKQRIIELLARNGTLKGLDLEQRLAAKLNLNAKLVERPLAALIAETTVEVVSDQAGKAAGSVMRLREQPVAAVVQTNSGQNLVLSAELYRFLNKWRIEDSTGCARSRLFNAAKFTRRDDAAKALADLVNRKLVTEVATRIGTIAIWRTDRPTATVHPSSVLLSPDWVVSLPAPAAVIVKELVRATTPASAVTTQVKSVSAAPAAKRPNGSKTGGSKLQALRPKAPQSASRNASRSKEHLNELGGVRARLLELEAINEQQRLAIRTLAAKIKLLESQVQHRLTSVH